MLARKSQVGSMNLNMRSAYLNAESALIIESQELARAVAGAITLNMQPQNSWRVALENGELTWTTDRAGAVVEMHREPDTPRCCRSRSTCDGLHRETRCQMIAAGIRKHR